MIFEGTQVQNAIFFSGEAAWPISHTDWEARAERAIDPRAFGYIAGGAGVELTTRANREAFDRWVVPPRVLAGIREVDLRTHLLGEAVRARLSRFLAEQARTRKRSSTGAGRAPGL